MAKPDNNVKTTLLRPEKKAVVEYAKKEDIPVSQAARYFIRKGLEATGQIK